MDGVESMDVMDFLAKRDRRARPWKDKAVFV
jgi:hypothetical protein